MNDEEKTPVEEAVEELAETETDSVEETTPVIEQEKETTDYVELINAVQASDNPEDRVGNLLTLKAMLDEYSGTIQEQAATIEELQSRVTSQTETINQYFMQLTTPLDEQGHEAATEEAEANAALQEILDKI